jgi:hypothetical protein
LHGALAQLGYRVAPEPAPIVPVFLDDGEAGETLSARLYEFHVVVQPVGHRMSHKAHHGCAQSHRLRIRAKISLLSSTPSRLWHVEEHPSCTRSESTPTASATRSALMSAPACWRVPAHAVARGLEAVDRDRLVFY